MVPAALGLPILPHNSPQKMHPASGEERTPNMGKYAGQFSYNAKEGKNLGWLDSFAVPWGTQAIVELEWSTDNEIKLALDQARQGRSIILFSPAFRMDTTAALEALKDAGIDPGISVSIREVQEDGRPTGIPFQLSAEKTWIESLLLVDDVVRIVVGMDGAKVTQEYPARNSAHGHHHHHGHHHQHHGQHHHHHHHHGHHHHGQR
jgi:hypothetical protein